MPPRLLIAALALASGAIPVARAQAGAGPAEGGAGDAARGQALAQCEKAVDQSLHEIRGKQVADLQFSAGERDVAAEGDHLAVKGEGRYRRGGGAPVTTFRYSCAFDAATGATSGVLLHESDEASAAALPVWQADLTRLSPEACETAAATQLQSQHPRASGIAFDGEDRKLEPGAEGRTALSGTGHLVRAPGMQPSLFRYRCEFDGSGRLQLTRASD